MRPLCCVLATASSLAAPLVAAQQVRDSAGIRIVENSRPVLPAARMWRLLPQLILEIGKADGDTLYEFLRVNGVARLSDGRIAVANDGTRTIRFYDQRGIYLGAFGREGDGPGEFRQILQFRRIRGDTLVVTDHIPRLSYFSPAGRLARVVTPAPGQHLWPWIMLYDGSYLGVPGRTVRREATRSGQWVDSTVVLRVVSEPVRYDTVGRYRQAVFYSRMGFPETLIFGPRLRLAASGDQLYVGFGDRYEIQVFSLPGKLRRIIRRSAARRPVSAEAIREHRERSANRLDEMGRPASPAMRERFARLAESAQFASELPAYSRFHLDPTGHLWVQQFEVWEDAPDRYGPVSALTGPSPTTWDVFDARGAWLGRLEMPARFTPLEIGADYVAGLWRDADDVEFVRLYRLIKP